MAPSGALRVAIPGAGDAPDVLGLWQTTAAHGSAIVWDVDVAADPVQARALLQASNARVLTALEAIPATEDRLQQFLRESRDPASSFATPAPVRGEPEHRLAALLAPEAPAQAFVLDDLRRDLALVLRQARDFSDQVRRTLGQPALVRSSARGRALGHTRVTWSGDARTFWPRGLTRSDAQIHEQAVRLALATVQAWLRIAALVGAGAVQLSLLLPTGIGALRALPAMWAFITAILEEYQQLRRLSA